MQRHAAAGMIWVFYYLEKPDARHLKASYCWFSGEIVISDLS